MMSESDETALWAMELVKLSRMQGGGSTASFQVPPRNPKNTDMQKMESLSFSYGAPPKRQTEQRDEHDLKKCEQG